MTWDAQRIKYGRRPFQIIEIDYDRCSLTYGNVPCTASIGVTGEIKCFNTRATCQDADNFTAADSTLKFCQASSEQPRSETFFPFVTGIEHSPSAIDPGKSLGRRASLKITMQDAPHHDRGIDPYVTERTYAPAEQGTFWGKFLARVPYYRGRTLRWLSGYLADDGSYDAANFQTRYFVIERIDGPDADGRVSIVAKDPLKLADDERAQAPAASTGTLDAGISDSDTTLTLSDGSGYPDAGKIRIGSEVISYTKIGSPGGEDLNITRAQNNTTAAAHSAGDQVQLCLDYSSQSIDVIVSDLLQTYAGVPASYIPTADWAQEVSDYLPRLYTALITEPTGVKQLLSELTEQVPHYVWWDERDQEIKLRALKSPSPTTVYNDDEHFLADSITQDDDQERRISRVVTYVGQIDPTKSLDDVTNWATVRVSVDLDTEGADKYGQVASKKIFARWITTANTAAADEMNAELLARYAEAPRLLDFELDPKDAGLWTGDVFQAATRFMQDATGAAETRYFQVLSVKEHKDRYKYKALNFTYVGSDSDTRQVIISSDSTDVDIRVLYESIYGRPDGTETIQVIVESGVTVGATEIWRRALSMGVWPGSPGPSLSLINYGRIQGKGGDGGDTTLDGEDGGAAFYTRFPVTIDNTSGEIYGGGGGGGGGSSTAGPHQAKGGGGAGTLVGLGPGNASDGTADAGGAGYLSGGDGGGPGQAGQNGTTGNGGAAGAAVDGDSYITWTATGDIQGSQIN